VLVRIRIAPDEIEVSDRAAAIAWLALAALVAAMTLATVTALREHPAGVGAWAAMAGLAVSAGGLWLSRRLWLVRCRFDARQRRATFRRRRLRERQHRALGFDEIAEIVLREHTDSDGDVLRGVHVVTRDGERIDVIGTDQTDGDRFTPLVEALRAMIARTGRASPRPASPRA